MITVLFHLADNLAVSDDFQVVDVRNPGSKYHISVKPCLLPCTDKSLCAIPDILAYGHGHNFITVLQELAPLVLQQNQGFTLTLEEVYRAKLHTDGRTYLTDVRQENSAKKVQLYAYATQTHMYVVSEQLHLPILTVDKGSSHLEIHTRHSVHAKKQLQSIFKKRNKGYPLGLKQKKYDKDCGLNADKTTAQLLRDLEVINSIIPLESLEAYNIRFRKEYAKQTKAAARYTVANQTIILSNQGHAYATSHLYHEMSHHMDYSIRRRYGDAFVNSIMQQIVGRLKDQPTYRGLEVKYPITHPRHDYYFSIHELFARLFTSYLEYRILGKTHKYYNSVLDFSVEEVVSVVPLLEQLIQYHTTKYFYNSY